MLLQLSELLKAMEGDELAPHFQPVVHLGSGSLIGFEVLARWNHPVKGFCLPGNFIELAERNGLIGALCNRIFTKAFQAAAALPEPLTLAINISPIQLHYGSLPDQIKAAADEAGFSLTRLTLEITESALARDIKRSQQLARRMKDLGCKLSLDDFGTGYSSLGSLQALPFDELKIDRSFVESMVEKRESRKIVAAIAGLGSSLGMETVGEGVETQEQAEMLLLFGCSRVQGWLYGRAVPASELAAMVSAPPWLAPRLNARWEGSSLEAQPNQRLSQLQAIYDGAPVGLGFLDRGLRYVSLNRRLAEMNGLAVAGHLGKSIADLDSGLFPKVNPHLERALSGEAVSEVEVACDPTKSESAGTTRLVSYFPARDEAGEIVGVSLAVVDISERKRVEHALQESIFLHQHMATICRQTSWTMDGQGRDLQIGAPSIAGDGTELKAEEHPEWLEEIHPEDREPTIETMRRGLRSALPIDVEYRVKSAAGDWRWVRCRASPRLGSAGEVLRWYGGVEDIDKLKRAEIKLEDTEQALEAFTHGLPVLIVADPMDERSAMFPARREDAAPQGERRQA